MGARRDERARQGLAGAVFTPSPALRSNDEPAKLDTVLDRTLGGELTSPHPEITALALEIIDQYDLQASLAQWAAIQRMIEQGIRAGIARAS